MVRSLTIIDNGNPELRQVASRAKFGWPGAQFEEDDTDEMDDAREERLDLSDTIDSGDEPDDDAGTEGLRPNGQREPADKPP